MRLRSFVAGGMGLVGLGFALVARVAMAQAAAPAAAPQQVPGQAAQSAGAPGWINIALIVGIVFFMWLFVFRPQSKRAKEQRDFLAALAPGMDVVTNSGIVGTIEEIQDNVISLRVAAGTTLRVLKASVATKFEKKITVEAAK